MESFWAWIASFVCTLSAGAILGWSAAHTDVSQECQRLGGFYVGSKTFECKAK